jgi:heptosyltransferase-2
MTDKSFISTLLFSTLKKYFSIKENASRELGSINKILVIRQHNQLGDLLAGVSIFRALKEKYPNSHLTLVASNDNYQGAVKNKFIDRLYVFNKTKMFNPIKLYSFIHFLREYYDLVIVPVTVSISFTSNLMARISNSKIRIGPNSLDGKINESAFFFDRRVDIDWGKFPDCNVAEQILEIIRPFGIGTNDFRSEISFDEIDISAAKEFLSKTGVTKNSKLVGLHVGAGKVPNRWSLVKFVKLIHVLRNEFECCFFLTGSDADKEAIDYVEKNSDTKLNKYLNRPIPEVAALISISNLFITNDTGIMHVAGATNTPQISLFGPTNPFNWSPCGKNKIFIRKSDLIDDISVEDVLKVCKSFLED